jgi:hypothetical protein
VTDVSEIALVVRRYHCPSWCVKDDISHERESKAGAGRARHLSPTWMVDGFQIFLTSTTEFDGAVRGEPVVHINGARMKPARARTLAAAIAAAGALAG